MKQDVRRSRQHTQGSFSRFRALSLERACRIESHFWLCCTVVSPVAPVAPTPHPSPVLTKPCALCEHYLLVSQAYTRICIPCSLSGPSPLRPIQDAASGRVANGSSSTASRPFRPHLMADQRPNGGRRWQVSRGGRCRGRARSPPRTSRSTRCSAAPAIDKRGGRQVSQRAAKAMMDGLIWLP